MPKLRGVGVDVTRANRKTMRTLVADARAFVASTGKRTTN